MSKPTSTAAGTTIGIASGNPATFDANGFKALSFALIGKIKNVGEFGKSFELIRSQYLDQRGVEKRKGTFDAGSLSVEVDIKTDDGQAACEAALDSDADFNFSIRFKTGTTYYLRGQVVAFTKKVGGPNDMLAATINIELNTFVHEGVELAAVKSES